MKAVSLVVLSLVIGFLFGWTSHFRYGKDTIYSQHLESQLADAVIRASKFQGQYQSNLENLDQQVSDVYTQSVLNGCISDPE